MLRIMLNGMILKSFVFIWPKSFVLKQSIFHLHTTNNCKRRKQALMHQHE